MRSGILFLAVVLCLVGSITALEEPRVRVEAEHISGEIRAAPVEAPKGWKQLFRLDQHATLSKTPLKLTFVLKLSESAANELETLFWEVSNPKSSQYGQYLNNEEIAAMIAPPAEHLERIISYVTRFPGVEVEDAPVTGDMLRVYAPVNSAQKIVGCTYHMYEHVESGIQVARCVGEYTLPASVEEVVSFVGGVSRFPSIQKKKVSSDSSLALAVDPRVLRDRYAIGDTFGGLSANNSQAVHQFLGQYYSPFDLAEFFILFFSEGKGQTPTVLGPDNGAPGIEASLDIEYIMSTGAKVPTQFWSNVEADPNADPFLDWMYKLNNATNPPLVNSISYGDDEEDLSRHYAHSANIAFMKGGVRGLSILFAAGDSGVGGSGFGCKKFVPDFPAVSPYITAVGGTQLGFLEEGDERVWPDGGGGFSNYYAAPSYQADIVKSYLANTQDIPASTYFNASGRAYPDIAALAYGFVIVYNKVPTPGVGGTSCATPTYSGIISLLNDLRLSKGEPTLGFLNPWLYQNGVANPQIFTDITTGSNPGCSTNGFPATKGWDASSGWGSPLYSAMASIV